VKIIEIEDPDAPKKPNHPDQPAQTLSALECYRDGKYAKLLTNANAHG
jgi:hypothetical protein